MYYPMLSEIEYHYLIIVFLNNDYQCRVKMIEYMKGAFKASRDFSGLAWVQYDATYRRQAAVDGGRC